MLPKTEIRDWARRLIASEVDVDSPSVQTERVYENLRRHLCAPVGVDGFQSLARRALSLAKSQSVALNGVQVLANGGLTGLKELHSDLDTEEDDEVGITLIAQLLGLVLTLLGESATAVLIADVPSPANVPLRVQVETTFDRNGKIVSAPSTNFLGPFDDILSEADHLRRVSERLETLVDKHVGIEEVMSVAGSIRNIAAVLDVFTVIRNKAGGSQDGPSNTSPNGYMNCVSPVSPLPHSSPKSPLPDQEGTSHNVLFCDSEFCR